MSNMQNPHNPQDPTPGPGVRDLMDLQGRLRIRDPQDPITVTRKDLRLLLQLAMPTLDPWGSLWRSVFIHVNYPYPGWAGAIRQVTEALGEWPVASEWISLVEAWERWGE